VSACLCLLCRDQRKCLRTLVVLHGGLASRHELSGEAAAVFDLFLVKAELLLYLVELGLVADDLKCVRLSRNAQLDRRLFKTSLDGLRSARVHGAGWLAGLGRLVVEDPDSNCFRA